MARTTCALAVLCIVLASAHGTAYAQNFGTHRGGYDERADFAAILEEILAHLGALELSLDEGNAELAFMHASYPMEKIYPVMEPGMATAIVPNDKLDDEMQAALASLPHDANTDVPREQAQDAIDNVKHIVGWASFWLIGGMEVHADFRMRVMTILLETSIAKYYEAVDDGKVTSLPDLHTGSAFVGRSQQIFDEIRSVVPGHSAEKIDGLYDEIDKAYDRRADPVDVRILANGIISEIYTVLDFETEEQGHIKSIRTLLNDTRTAYAAGDTRLALSHATRAYLDNYEYLEGPLVEAGQEELMMEVEVMMREDLRHMIQNGAPVFKVNEQIDAILIRIDAVGMIVPEFGVAALTVLGVSILAISVPLAVLRRPYSIRG